MQRTAFTLTLSVWILLSVPGVGRAGDPPSGEVDAPETEVDVEAGAIGHWEGDILGSPGHKLGVVVDLERVAEKTWQGHLDLEGRSIYDLPLKNVAVDGKKVRFELTVLPGEPAVEAELAEDGASMTGQYTQAGQSFTIRLSRTSTEPESAKGLDPAVMAWVGDGVPGKGVVAVWRGAIVLGSGAIQVELKIRQTEDGGYSGTFESVNQEGIPIPVTALVFDEGTLSFEVSSVNGRFKGRMNEDGSVLSGSWAQGSGELPFSFKRAAESPL